MKVLVCGSRTYGDGESPEAFEQRKQLYFHLEGMFRVHSEESSTYFTVIEGGARGADSAAAFWAKGPNDRVKDRGFYSSARVRLKEYLADWDKHGGRAGYMRNAKMLHEGQPDLVLAFIDKPLEDSHGTFNMVTQARKAGVPVYVIRYYGKGK